MEGTSKEIHYHDTTWENKYDFTTTCFTNGLFRNLDKGINFTISNLTTGLSYIVNSNIKGIRHSNTGGAKSLN